MSEKKKSADETLKIIEEIIDYNKGTQKTFSISSKVNKRKSEPKPEESIAERIKLGRQQLRRTQHVTPLYKNGILKSSKFS